MEQEEGGSETAEWLNVTIPQIGRNTKKNQTSLSRLLPPLSVMTTIKDTQDQPVRSIVEKYFFNMPI